MYWGQDYVHSLLFSHLSMMYFVKCLDFNLSMFLFDEDLKNFNEIPTTLPILDQFLNLFIRGI